MNESMQPMTARQYAPIERLDQEPMARPYVPVTRAQRESALHDALRGVELGDYDQRIMAWLLRILDDGTLRTVVSLIERVRTAGVKDALDAEAALQREKWRQYY